jgi:hypothetical protein
LLLSSPTEGDVEVDVVVVLFPRFWNKFFRFPVAKFFFFVAPSSSPDEEEGLGVVVDVVVVPLVRERKGLVFLVGSRSLGFVVGEDGVSVVVDEVDVDVDVDVVDEEGWFVCSTMESSASSSLSYSSVSGSSSMGWRRRPCWSLTWASGRPMSTGLGSIART